MSANNYLLIKQLANKWGVYDCDAETFHKVKVGDRMRLEAAIKLGMKYAQDNVIEYGFQFDFKSNREYRKEKSYE